jgi:hypothetical protein
MLFVSQTECDIRISVTETIVRRNGLHSLKFRGTAKALSVKKACAAN